MHIGVYVAYILVPRYNIILEPVTWIASLRLHFIGAWQRSEETEKILTNANAENIGDSRGAEISTQFH